jgi:2-iminobutanoate/2-iminopropanoate deaminase
MKSAVSPFAGGPPASGPYSLAVRSAGPLLFVSGQGPHDLATGKVVRGTIGEQTRLTLENIAAIVAHAGGRMENAVSARVFLQPLTPETFAEMNAAYAEFWGPAKPARSTVGVQLAGIDVEIDCVIALD